MLLRILASLLLLISVLFWPFWISIILALAGMIYFNVFLEAVVLFLLSDVLFGIKETSWGGMMFVSFVVSAIVLVIIEVTKKKLKFYPHT